MLNPVLNLRVRRTVGSPDVRAVNDIRFANGGLNVTDNGGGSVTVTNSVFGTALLIANNLSDLADFDTARTNLLSTGFSPASGDVMTFNGSLWTPTAISVPVGANPTATVGTAAVNGSASTFLRSDGAPAINLTMAPTWTGLHTFQAQTSARAAVFKAAATTPANVIELQSSGGTVFAAGAVSGTNLLVTAPTATDVPIGIVLASGQSAAAMEVRNNAATLMSQLTAAGGLYLSSNSVFSTSAAFSWSSSTAFNTSCFVVGDASNLINFTAAGLTVSQSGNAPTLNLRPFFASQSSTTPYDLILSRPTYISGSGGIGAGSQIRFQCLSSTTNDQDQSLILSSWATATHATRKGQLLFYAYDDSNKRLGMTIGTSGSAALVGFYATAPVALQTVTGSRGGNAALADLLTKLANLGLIIDGTS